MKAGAVLVDTLAAAAAAGRPAGTVRRWQHEGKLQRQGTDERGRALYDLQEVYDVARAHRPKKEAQRPR